jgi:hypothetical protein
MPIIRSLSTAAAAASGLPIVIRDNYHKIYTFVQHICNLLQKYSQATCFGPLGPSSGLTYEQVPLILVHFGIPNCYKNVIKYCVLLNILNLTRMLKTYVKKILKTMSLKKC